MLKARIFNIQTMSTEDGPGIRTSVFFKGCPLSCLWCQNPEGLSREVHLVHEPTRCIGCGSCINICRNQALSFEEAGLNFGKACKKCCACAEECPAAAIRVIGEDISVDGLKRKLLTDKPFYDNSGGGVTFTGGECLIQHDFVAAITKEMKDAGVHVAVDTSGYVNSDSFRTGVENADLILYDLKIIDDKLHKKYTGVPAKLILENAGWLRTARLPVWVRIPVIPGYTADLANIEAVAGFIREEMASVVERIDLLGYNDLCSGDYSKMKMDYSLQNVPRVRESEMEKLLVIMKKTGVENIVISNYRKGE